MARIFKPLSSESSKETADFLTMDIETKDGLKGEEIYIGCLFSPNKNSNNYYLFENMEEYFNILKAFIPSKNTRRKKGNFKNIFIHNLTFDIRFILEYAVSNSGITINYISSGSKDLVVEITFIEEKFTFRHIDSLQFTLCSQEKLEKAILKKQIKRVDIKVGEDLTLTKDDYTERVKSDCLGLYYSLKSYFKSINSLFLVKINSGRLISLAGLALKIFRTNYLPENIYNPYIKGELLDNQSKEKTDENFSYEVENKDILDLIFLSYFGGRTELFKKGIFENVTCWDINSLYPSVFSNDYPINSLKTPIQTEKIYSMEELEYNLKYNEGFLDNTEFGIIYEKYSQIPVLPSKDSNGRTAFLVGYKKGVFTFPEIRYCLEHQLIEIGFPVNLIRFKRGNFFNGFGEDTFNKRRKFQQENSPIELPVKIVMNGLYGKFGQKIKQKGIRLLSFSERLDYYNGVKQPEEFLNQKGKVLEVREFNDITLIYYETESVSIFTLPHIASYVTAYARLKLHEALIANSDSILYCDTDSIWITEEPNNIIQGTELGEWKKEKVCSKGAFIALKYYAYEFNNELKIRIKGVSQNMIEQAKFSSIEDFFDRSTKIIYVERLRFNTIRKSLRESHNFVSSSIRTKHLSGKYTKREILENGETKPKEILNIA